MRIIARIGVITPGRLCSQTRIGNVSGYRSRGREFDHTFVEIDHEIISTVILLLPLIYLRRVVVSYKLKYVHKLLVNRLLKPAQEKVWLSELAKIYTI